MSNCTNVGFSGKAGFQLNGQNLLPLGEVCMLSGFAQALDTQKVTVTNSKGDIVAQIAGNGGTNGIPAAMVPSGGCNNYFTADGNAYTITFTNSGGQDSQVLYQGSNITNQNTASPYAFIWTFITEDTPNGGDCDFNDSMVTLFWSINQG